VRVASFELLPLVCVGADGVAREFYYRVTHDMVAGSDGMKSAWHYIVFDNEDPDQDAEEFFEAEFVEVDAERVLSRTMSHRFLAQYRRKGIPEAVIRDAARRLKRRVVSSSGRRALIDETESRTEFATKVWLRLVDAGLEHRVRRRVRECCRRCVQATRSRGR
jgi:hypothetical protein